MENSTCSPKPATKTREEPYPESVHVDQIYRTRANRAFCKANGIRMSGPRLGRPPKDVSAATKKQSRADEAIRNTVEGKFGEAKRRYGLSRVMAKLATTSAAQVSLSFLVMNLEAALRRLLSAIMILLTRWLIKPPSHFSSRSHPSSPHPQPSLRRRHAGQTLSVRLPT